MIEQTVRLDGKLFFLSFELNYFYDCLLEVIFSIPVDDREKLLAVLAFVGDELDPSEWDEARTIRGVCIKYRFGYGVYLSRKLLQGRPAEEIKELICHEFYHAILDHGGRNDEEQCEIEVDEKVKACFYPASGHAGYRDYKKFSLDWRNSMRDVTAVEANIKKIESKIAELKKQSSECEAAIVSESQSATTAFLENKNADSALEKSVKLEFKKRGLETAIGFANSDLTRAREELRNVQIAMAEDEAKQIAGEIDGLAVTLAVDLYEIYKTSCRASDLQQRHDLLKNTYGISTRVMTLDMRGQIRMKVYIILSLLESYLGEQFASLKIPSTEKNETRWDI